MADVKISSLPAAANSNSADQIPTNQAGTTRRVTTSQISDFVKSVAPAISQNAGVAFGVQQNNTSTRTMLVIVNIHILTDHLSPGAQQVDVITNASNPNPIATFFFNSGGGIIDPELQFSTTVAVSPGGFYTINNTSDPGGGNTISSVWEILL